MMPVYVRRLFFAILIYLSAGIALRKQTVDLSKTDQSKSAQSKPNQSKPNQDDPLARPKKSQKPGKIENAYKRWRDDDVVDIITPEELAAFNKLSNDAERDSFVEAFWRRRESYAGHGRERI